jgi:hypothetical protein
VISWLKKSYCGIVFSVCVCVCVCACMHAYVEEMNMLQNVFQVITIPVLILVKNVVINTVYSRYNAVFGIRHFLLDKLSERDEPAEIQ